MTNKYIALLRGINVGGHVVKMERLRELFEELGVTNVGSYITSGNIFFTTDIDDRAALSAAIEQHLSQTLGFAVPVFLRTSSELEAIVNGDPFKNIEPTEDNRFCVVFTRQSLDTNLPLPMPSTKHDMDLVATRPYEAFVVWHIINGRPPSGAFAVGVLPIDTTTRFFHTLGKILQASKK